MMAAQHKTGRISRVAATPPLAAGRNLPPTFLLEYRDPACCRYTDKDWQEMETTVGTQLSELRQLIARRTSSDGDHQTAVRSLWLIRHSSAWAPSEVVLSHALCIAAQGHKEVVLGKEVYSCVPGQYLVSPFDLPVSARILGATPRKPYLGLKWEFDPARLRPLIEEAHLSRPPAKNAERRIYVAAKSSRLLDAILRLVRLLQYPSEIPVLAPMIEREILLRLLLDKNGAVLHQMATPECRSERIAVATTWLRKNYRQPMRVDRLARNAGMSLSSFHHWFRTITGRSPLQYQKQLRLQEARTILRNEKLNVASVSRRVGYESSSQFSREYSRLFGTPPVREIGKAWSAN